jgi:predicted enzyme related to lactoylglutathione lyase
MERVTGIGGVFFKSADPAALLAWYRENLGIEPAFESGTVFRWSSETSSASAGSTTWAIFPADSDYFGPPPSPFMVNFRVRDLDAMLAQLRAAGAQVDDRVEEIEFGRFGWAVDPDGNRFELWEPAEDL